MPENKWARLLAYVTGLVNQKLLLQNEYLAAENRDTDNVFVNNTIARNGSSGVYFREETLANSGHRNTFRNNQVLDNGDAKSGYGFYIMPSAGDLIIENNRIAETRKSGGTQRVGIYKAAGAGSLQSRNNTMSGHLEGDYRDGAAKRSGSQ